MKKMTKNEASARKFVKDCILFREWDEARQEAFLNSLISVECQRNEDGECVAFRIYNAFGNPTEFIAWGIYTGGFAFSNAGDYAGDEDRAMLDLFNEEVNQIISNFNFE